MEIEYWSFFRLIKKKEMVSVYQSQLPWFQKVCCGYELYLGWAPYQFRTGEELLVALITTRKAWVDMNPMIQSNLLKTPLGNLYVIYDSVYKYGEKSILLGNELVIVYPTKEERDEAFN